MTYRLDKKIGEGGMGAVYRAVHEDLNRVVALKVLTLDMAPEAVARFEREMKMLAKLSHPHIVRFYDSGTLDDRLYFTMELVDGCDLNQLRKNSGRLAFKDAINWMTQAADALAYLHSKGLVHRDLKPANLMIDSEGRLLVMDFGLAKDSSATMLTAEGRIVGTPRFMAPELLKSYEGGPPVDVWALALSMHELLSGQAVFSGLSMTEMVAAILQGPPPDLEPLCPETPRWFLEIQRICLQTDPASRPTSRELHSLLLGRGASAPRVGGVSSRRTTALVRPGSQSVTVGGPGNRPPWGRVAAAGITLVAVAALVVATGRGPPGPGSSTARGDPTASIDASRPVTPAAGVLWTGSVRPEPPRRLVATLRGLLPDGARVHAVDAAGVSVPGRLEPSARDKTGPHKVVFDDLPPETGVTLELTGLDRHQIVARLPVKTPRVARLMDMLVNPTDIGAMVDFQLLDPVEVTVEMGRWGQGAVQTRLTQPAGPLHFHHLLADLRPRTDYFLRVIPTEQWGGIIDARVQTREESHAKGVSGSIRQLGTGWQQNVYTLDILRFQPDERTVPALERVFRSHPARDVAEHKKLHWAAEDLRDERLSAALLVPITELMNSLDVQRSSENKQSIDDLSMLMRGAYSGRHRATIETAKKILVSTKYADARRWAARAVALLPGPASARLLLDTFERSPEFCEEESGRWLLKPDWRVTKERYVKWMTPPHVEQRTRTAKRGLAWLGDSSVAAAVGPLLDRCTTDGERSAVCWVLARCSGPMARQNVLRAFERLPADQTLVWTAARLGLTQAAATLARQLVGSAVVSVRRSAAIALGLLDAKAGLERESLMRALADPAMEVSQAAAWALGRVGEQKAAAVLAQQVKAGLDPTGMALLALARLSRIPGTDPKVTSSVGEFVLRRLESGSATPPTTESMALGRSVIDGWAVGLLVPPARRAQVLALETAKWLPRPVREMIGFSLESSATVVGRREVLIVPQSPFERTGIQLHVGQSVEISAWGAWTWSGFGDGLSRSDIATPDSGSPCKLGAVAIVGERVVRLERKPQRLVAEQDTELLLGAYQEDPDPASMPLSKAVGLARVVIDR